MRRTMNPFSACSQEYFLVSGESSGNQMKHLGAVLLCLSFSVTAAPSWGADKAYIGVLELAGNGVSLEEARGLTDRLRAELFQTGRFVVVEREKMDEILREQGFQQSGACNTDVCAVEVGKLIGAQEMVVGSVSKVGKTYSVNLRLIDVERGVMVRSALRDCSCQIDRLLTETIGVVVRQLAGPFREQSARPRGRSHLKWVAITIVAGGGVSAAIITKDRWLGGSKDKRTGTIKLNVPWP